MDNLKRQMQTLGLLLIGIILAAPTMGQAWENFSDIPEDAPVAPPVSSPAPRAPVGGLTFYTNEATFLADNPGLVFEDFSDTNVGPDLFLNCPGPFNTNTNDGCFSPGAIPDGIEFDTIDNVPAPNDVVVLTPSRRGVTDVMVGPFNFDDDLSIVLYQGPGVPATNTFGGTFACVILPTTFNISVYFQGSLLGQDTLTCGGPPGNFWGINNSAGLIDEIVLEGIAGNEDAELVGNVYFGEGNVAVPTMGEFMTLAGFLALLVVSAFFVWRRRTI